MVPHDLKFNTPHRCAPYSIMPEAVFALSSSSSSPYSTPVPVVMAAFTTNVILPTSCLSNLFSSSSPSLRYICPTTLTRPLCARAARTPRWLARARSGGKRSRSNKRQSSNNSRSRSDSGSGRSSADDSNLRSNLPLRSKGDVGDSDDLTSMFEEDVTAPLNRSSRRGGKSRADNKRGRNIQQAKPSPIDGLSRALPKSRQEAIDLLVRGAWTGIFVMILIFVSVHLFIVGDWVGRK